MIGLVAAAVAEAGGDGNHHQPAPTLRKTGISPVKTFLYSKESVISRSRGG